MRTECGDTTCDRCGLDNPSTRTVCRECRMQFCRECRGDETTLCDCEQQRVDQQSPLFTAFLNLTRRWLR